MKVFGIIFSLLVLTLNTVPCCWNSCFEEEPVEQHSNADQSCCTFLSCGNCTIFVLQQDMPEISLYIQPSVLEVEFLLNHFYTEFSETIWQPPQSNNDLLFYT